MAASPGRKIAYDKVMKKLSLLIPFVFATAVILSPFGRAAAGVRVRIYAASWCGYCKMLRTGMVAETGSNKTLRVDGVDLSVGWIEDNRAEETKAGVRSYPTTIVTSEDGKIIERTTGANLPRH